MAAKKRAAPTFYKVGSVKYAIDPDRERLRRQNLADMRAAVKRHTYHARRDFFLGGFNAVLKLDGVVKWMSSGSFPTRGRAISAARFHLQARYL